MTRGCSTKAADAKVELVAKLRNWFFQKLDRQQRNAFFVAAGIIPNLELADALTAEQSFQAFRAALEVADTRQDREQGSGASADADQADEMAAVLRGNVASQRVTDTSSINFRELAIAAILHNTEAWKPSDTAPKDGTHILACGGGYSPSWGFDQSPPFVVHYFPDPSEPGFYLSSGLVQDSYNDKPQKFLWWRHLGQPPAGGRP